MVRRHRVDAERGVGSACRPRLVVPVAAGDPAALRQRRRVTPEASANRPRLAMAGGRRRAAPSAPSIRCTCASLKPGTTSRPAQLDRPVAGAAIATIVPTLVPSHDPTADRCARPRMAIAGAGLVRPIGIGAVAWTLALTMEQGLRWRPIADVMVISTDHDSSGGRPMARPSAGSSSCRRAGRRRRRRRATSRRMRSRSSPERRSACSSTIPPSRALAEQILVGVHRLGDAVGEETRRRHPCGAAIVLLLEQVGELLPAPSMRRPRTIPLGMRTWAPLERGGRAGRWMSGVWPARAYVIDARTRSMTA